MERLQRMLGAGGGMGGAGAGVGDAPQQDTSEQIYISSLALLKMLKHGRAGVPLEVMGLMLGEFVDEFTVKVVDVFAMPQSGTGVSVEAVDPVFQTKMLDMLKQTGRWVCRWGLQGQSAAQGRWRAAVAAASTGVRCQTLCASAMLTALLPCICCCVEINGLSASTLPPRLPLPCPCPALARPLLAGPRWWWGGTTATPASGAGCLGWTSTRSSRSRHSTSAQ